MGRRTRLQDPRTVPPVAPAEVKQRPEPAAWRLALHFADGDPRRLEVIDPRTIIVRNRPA